MDKSDILKILRQNNSVFTFKDISLIWGETDQDFVKKKIHRYIKSGKLYPIRRGIYAKDKNYNKQELAVKIFTPSYISFETVLGPVGIIFQYWEQIFVASYLTRNIVVESQTYSYKKIKNEILTNHAGIENKENYSIASLERAFLDTLYLNKDYHFDNLSPLSWEKVFEILSIYKSKRMTKSVNKYYKDISK